jgi:hypothetical protein
MSSINGERRKRRKREDLLKKIVEILNTENIQVPQNLRTIEKRIPNFVKITKIRCELLRLREKEEKFNDKLMNLRKKKRGNKKNIKTTEKLKRDLEKTNNEIVINERKLEEIDNINSFLAEEKYQEEMYFLEDIERKFRGERGFFIFSSILGRDVVEEVRRLLILLCTDLKKVQTIISDIVIDKFGADNRLYSKIYLLRVFFRGSFIITEDNILRIANCLVLAKSSGPGGVWNIFPHYKSDIEPFNDFYWIYKPLIAKFNEEVNLSINDRYFNYYLCNIAYNLTNPVPPEVAYIDHDTRIFSIWRLRSMEDYKMIQFSGNKNEIKEYCELKIIPIYNVINRAVSIGTPMLHVFNIERYDYNEIGKLRFQLICEERKHSLYVLY